MAKTLEELENEFGGGAKTPAASAGPASLEDLEKQFSRSGASEIPVDPAMKKPAAAPAQNMFEPGFMGGVKKGLAQIGSGMADIPLAIRQMTGSATPEEVEEKRRIDAQLNKGAVGAANNFLGKVAPALIAPPGIGGTLPTVLGYNALVGGLQGAAEPTGPDESRPLNTAIGMVGGAAGPGIANLVTSALKPAAGQASELAKRAVAMGIPLGPADITDSAFVKSVRSLLNDLPITGKIGKAHNEAVNEAITREVGKTIGLNSPSLDAATLNAQKKVLGRDFDKLWNNTQIDFDANLFGAVQQLESRLDELPPHTAASMRKYANDIMNKVVDDGTGRLYIPGEYVNTIQSELGRLAGGGKGVERDIAGGFQRELLDAFERSTPPGSREALSKVKSQWKAMRTLEPLVNSAEAGVAGRESGQIPLALLPNRVKQMYPDVSASPFADLAPIAGRYGVDRTPKTGGSMRALLQNSGVGAGLGLGAYSLGASIPAILSGVALTGTAGAATQKALNSPALTRRLLAAPVKRALMGAPELQPALRGMAASTLTRAPVAGALSAVSGLSRAGEAPALEEE